MATPLSEKMLAQRFELFNALPRDRATVAGEKQNDDTGIGSAQLVVPAFVIQEAEVHDFFRAGGWRLSWSIARAAKGTKARRRDEQEN